MPQLSLYLDDPTMAALRGNAKSERKSLSRYVAELLESHEEKRKDEWPDSFWSTFGAIDDPTFVAPECVPWTADAPRESFD